MQPGLHISADFFDIGFAQHAAVMVPVDLAAIAATLAVLLLFFGRDIPPAYEVDRLALPAASAGRNA